MDNMLENTLYYPHNDSLLTDATHKMNILVIQQHHN